MNDGDQLSDVGDLKGFQFHSIDLNRTGVPSVGAALRSVRSLTFRFSTPHKSNGLSGFEVERDSFQDLWSILPVAEAHVINLPTGGGMSRQRFGARVQLVGIIEKSKDALEGCHGTLEGCEFSAEDPHGE